MKPDVRAPDAGFTLLELIVAVSILALIAVFSWRGLDALIREREALTDSQAAIDAVQRLFARVERDALTASDVQLDEAGLRFVAGVAALDGGPPASVDYRYADGTLTRNVAGVDRGPTVVVAGLSSLAIEAWVPAPRGGAWTRTKTSVQEAPQLDRPAVAGASAAGAAGATPSAAPPVPAAQLPQPIAGAGPSGSPATGIRVSFARAGGAPIVRTFLVGGG